MRFYEYTELRRKRCSLHKPYCTLDVLNRLLMPLTTTPFCSSPAVAGEERTMTMRRACLLAKWQCGQHKGGMQNDLRVLLEVSLARAAHMQHVSTRFFNFELDSSTGTALGWQLASSLSPA